MKTRVFVYPQATGEDRGDGGVSRIIRMQQDWLRDNPLFSLADSEHDCDVIACHITIPAQFTRDYPQIPIVAHIHGLYWDEYEWTNGSHNINKEVSHLIRVADEVTSPSEWVSRVIRQQYWRDARTIYHAVDADFWDAVPVLNDVQPYVLFDKTRTDPICEVDSLREIAKLLPHVRFLTTAWDDGERPDNVEMVGRVPFDQAAVLIKNAAVYLATTRETFGVSNVQALACGVPIVGYNWAGQREILEQAEPGAAHTFVRLVHPGDIEALAAVVESAWSQNRKWDQARALARERFDIETAMQAYASAWGAAAARESYNYDVSVIITAYGLEEYLPKAIESVLGQRGDGLRVECVIVDDKSPDACGEIADAYAAKYPDSVLSVHNERNLYLAGARNAGIAASSGKYIIPLDADDSLAPGALRPLYDALERKRAIDIAYGGVLFVEPDGREWNSGWPVQWTAERQVSGQNCLPYCSMYRRRVFDIIGGYRTRCHTAEDADFWLRSALAGFAAEKVTDANTLVYLNRPGSMSRVNATPKWWAWAPQQLPAGLVTGGLLSVPALDPPVIAVVIPVGNGHEKYLADALDSVYAQSYRNWECIVVDDTVDGEPFPFFPPWMRYIKTGGVGVAAARNAGIAHARARLFVPLDADDILQPHALEIMYEAYKDSDRTAVVYSDFWEDPEAENDYRIYRTPDYDCKIILRGGAFRSVTALTPKRYWEAVGGYNSNLYGWEDWGFMIALAANGYPSRRVPLPLFTYRKHTGFRRDANLGEKDRSRESFMAQFCGYEGTHFAIRCNGGDWMREEKMACACGAKASQNFLPKSQTLAQGAAYNPATADAELIQYNGPRLGAFTLRGPSGRSYRFSKGVKLWVLNQDATAVLRQPDFEIVPNGDLVDEREPALAVLVPGGKR